MSTGFGAFDTMSTLFPIVFLIFFVVIIGSFIYAIAHGIKTKVKNDNSPRLSVPAKVVAKRDDVTHHTHHSGPDNAMVHHSSSTWYYTTFEVESGDRMEFSVKSTEYGMLAEGDVGVLSFQGTRFLGFERRSSGSSL